MEAHIVIYSTTSTHTDGPRSMKFLYSLNRLTIATSSAVRVTNQGVTVFCRTDRAVEIRVLQIRPVGHSVDHRRSPRS
jgi:hypothetical protein